MPDMTVHRHGDRWAVAEEGAESPLKEFPTREEAEQAAREMAGGGRVDVRDEDPTSLEHPEPEGAGEPVQTGRPDEAAGPGAEEGVRAPQSGL